MTARTRPAMRTASAAARSGILAAVVTAILAKGVPAQNLHIMAMQDSIGYALASPDSCGFDLQRATALLSETEAGSSRLADYDRDSHVFCALAAIGKFLMHTPCLSPCCPDQCNPGYRMLLGRYRGKLTEYWGNRSANAAFRRHAVEIGVQAYDGPNIWEEGMSLLASRVPLSDGATEEKDWVAAFGPGEYALWRRWEPTTSLNVVAGEEYRYDKRLDILAGKLLREHSETWDRERERSLLDAEAAASLIRDTICKPARLAMTADLVRYLHSYHTLPMAIADSAGVPLPEVLPTLCNREQARFANGDNISCWFLGWPGLRIREYERKPGHRCRVTIDGLGFPFKDVWQLALE